MRKLQLAAGLALCLLSRTSVAADVATERRLWVFRYEVAAAARQLRVPKPQVRVVSYEEASTHLGVNAFVSAYVLPRDAEHGAARVEVLWRELMGASDNRLRCWARHEVSHLHFGHERGARTWDEADEQHRQVAELMRAKWNQDSACLAE